MIDVIFSALVGIIIYFLVLHFMPRSIKVKIYEFGANRAYKSSIKKLEQTIEKERKELEDKDKSLTNKLTEDNYKNLSDAKKEAENTKEKFIKLSEKYKHEAKRLFEVTTDWRDYNRFLADWVGGRCAEYMIEPDYEHIKEIGIRSQEIIKRYDRLISHS